MLVELRVQDFAIIDQVTLELGPGLVVFTGETGAGKSILVDAVEMMLGGRAESVFIRQGKDRALVEGTFHLQPPVRDAVAALLEPEGLLDDPEHLTLAREIRANGRHVARINGRTVSLHLLHAVGELLVDVHGQSEHLSLFRVREHLGLLDRFAGTEALLVAYRQVYDRLQEVRRALETLRRSDREAAQRADLLRFQIQEIEAAALTPGEEEVLREERTRLANAERLAALAQTVLTVLDEGASELPPAGDLLGEAVEAMEQLAHIDATQRPQAEALAAALEQVSDVVRAVRRYADELEFDPRRLEEVEERLALIENLKRKYGATIEEVLAYAERAREELENIANAEERIAELSAEEARLLAQLAERGLALSQARQQAARRLAEAVERELKDLRMAQARFRVEVQQQPDPAGAPLPDGRRVAFDAQGLDRVEFLLAPNPGEGFKPLAKIASGGESARLMLALKSVLAAADSRPTLIFDEVDQGIGGRIGAVVGEKLWRLARHHQVLCITHLPQLAAFGDQHLRVQKQVLEGRTVTRIEPLTGEARVLELAHMLGEVTDATLQSAYDLLQRAREVTQTAA